MMQLLKNKFRRYIYELELKKDYKKFLDTGKTSQETYRKFRKTFVLSKGNFNDVISKKISRETGKEQINAEGILGNLSKEKVKKIAAEIQEHGFFIFDKTLSEEVIDKIYNFALTEPVKYLNRTTHSYTEERVLFNPGNIISPRYNFSRSSIFKSEELQKLIFDESLRAVAQEYLGCKPILDHLAFWWSAPFGGEAKSEAAQMYHFDMDRFKWIKFFFYLTDVTPATGPHCYVRGSNGKLPKEITRDGRFTDEVIANIYGKENCIEICGKRGTIMAVDTRGFHKGKDLTEGHRLLFQIEFANSMFGQTYSSLDPALVKEEYKELLGNYSYKYLFKRL